MAVVIPALLLALFWVVVHLIHRLTVQRFLTPLLPRTRPLTRSSGPGSCFDPDYTSFHLSYVNLKLETTAFNAAHERLSGYLVNHGWLSFGKALYGVGAVIGIVGMFASLCIVAWTGLLVISETFLDTSVTPGLPPIARKIASRAISALPASLAPDSQASLALRPLIPGVTIPISHLPLMLIALFICQSFHEFGHAISAALEDTPLHSVGLALHVIVPTAFVSLKEKPSTTPSANLRLASAGALHNIFLWIAFYALAHSGLGRLATPIGWTDVSSLGKVVLGFNEATSLDGYMPRGSLVVQLDDTPLGQSARNAGQGDPWETFLLSKAPQELRRGWCLDSSEFVGSPTACCSEPSTAELTCFVPMSAPPSEYQGHCLSPLSLFNRNNTTPRRCDPAGCPGQDLCIVPSAESQLLRIAFVDMERGKERVVVWKGPRLEVYRQVRVGTYLPRTPLIPFWLPDLVNLFISYNLTVTIALYLFNLLPLPLLDGGQVLSSLLDLLFGADPSLGADINFNHAPWQRRNRRERIERAFHWGAGALCITVALAVSVKELTRS
ncbi:hypothetical protein DACRYDRAFT_120048 [Dacryopinax primogenitus]|uniref:Endopeptidase S2P n=1 Tax=Dacryopinax primogenitus (strain DJM 731) TaxID=1858805 RepID=M5FMZ6_DACPD|nr:uncharacterized protein DACRYDRAFT_120048 [Dacryopinax primogenitus]EJT96560.1 hypothetical protein DACRYDRAFT_120048 [Dacryopinax primogenitus]